MSEQVSSVRSKIAKLRAKFIEQLPERLANARSLFETLQVNPDDQEAAASLHRFFHGIKGTGNSFGFQALSAVAAQGEHLMAGMLAAPAKADPAFWRAMDERLDGIRRRLEDIQAGSAGLEHAAEFTGFELPQPPIPAGACESGGNLVYVCDDDTLLAEQLRVQLTCFGYLPVTFSDPETLRNAVLEKRPDAVIMDIGFPDGSTIGTDMVAALRQEMQHPVPVLFLSGRGDFQARLCAVQAGGEAYFQKPAATLDLVAALDELTRQQKPEPYRILVVDDEPEVADYHSLILREAGMVTTQLHDPVRVLDVVQEFRPDMVLMDMYMPGCSGRDLACLIRQVPDYVSLPIVYLSSETDKHKQFSAMRVGAEGFLTKPIQPDDLMAAVAIRAERMRALRSLMARDSLTGLYNHTTTTQLLEGAIAMAARRDASLCFVMIDVDRFKSVNDTYGHPVGDQVLLALARVLQQRLRNSDLVGRYGGEEFAVILHDASLDAAVKIVDQLRTDFEKVRFHAGNVEFSCTFSAGVAGFPKYQRMDVLREAADRSLYEAKTRGRNRVVADES